MARTFSEDDFEPTQPVKQGRVFSASDFSDSTNDAVAEAPAQSDQMGGAVLDAGLGATRALFPILGMTPNRIKDQALGAERALLTNEPTQSFGEGMLRGVPSTVGGMAGAAAALPAGPVAAIGGAVLGGTSGEAGRQGVAQVYSGLTGRGQVKPAGYVVKESAKQGLIQGAGQAISAGFNAMLPAIQKTGAQVMRAFTGIPEREGIQAIKDPSILSRALPADEAGAQYAESVGGLKSGAEAARNTLGKSHFSGESIADKFDELLPQIQDESIDTQTALALRQRLSKASADLPYNQRELKRLLSENINTVDTLLEKRLPEWPGAKTGYRESKIAEQFKSWLPLNKNLSPNVLRTVAAVGMATKGAIAGSPSLALGLPLISPKVWGYGIRGAGAVGGIIKTTPGEIAARSATSALADAYFKQ